MKSTGITRPVDELGRIVLPKELRREFDINEKDKLEIFTDGDRIILQKYTPSCIFCGANDTLTLFEGKRICRTCLSRLKTV